MSCLPAALSRAGHGRGAESRWSREPLARSKPERAAKKESTRSMVWTWIVWIVVGGIAGWLASLVVEGTGLGLLGDIIVGIIGGLIGGWLLSLVGLGGAGIIW